MNLDNLTKQFSEVIEREAERLAQEKFKALAEKWKRVCAEAVHDLAYIRTQRDELDLREQEILEDIDNLSFDIDAYPDLDDYSVAIFATHKADQAYADRHSDQTRKTVGATDAQLIAAMENAGFQTAAEIKDGLERSGVFVSVPAIYPRMRKLEAQGLVVKRLKGNAAWRLAK